VVEGDWFYVGDATDAAYAAGWALGFLVDPYKAATSIDGPQRLALPFSKAQVQPASWRLICRCPLDV